MTAQIIHLHRATMGPSYELANRLHEVGIDPHHITAADIVDPQLINHTFESIAGYTGNDMSRQKLEGVRLDQRFKFYVESSEDNEALGYRPQLVLGTHMEADGDVLGVNVNSEAIGRVVDPVVSLARACELVKPDDPSDDNYKKVIRVAVSSTLAIALSYAVFCEFGKFDTQNPCQPCMELEAIAEESSMVRKEGEPSGMWLRDVGLRFAGGIGMRYLAVLASQEFADNSETIINPEDATLMFGIILKSMALKDKAVNGHDTSKPVSYALENAYSPMQLLHVSNLWFR